MLQPELRGAVLSRNQRWSLFHRYGVGLSLLVTMYLVVTILRSILRRFCHGALARLGAPAQPATFSQSEICVALGVLLVNGCTVLVRDNRRAFFISLGTCSGRFLPARRRRSWADRAAWSTASASWCWLGLGLYLPYVAIHTTVFERLLAMTRDRGNIGFLMYVADAVGYLGYVAVMLLRNAMAPTDDLVDFFTAACWGAAIVSAFCLVGSWRYFGFRCAPPAQLVVAGDAA